MPIVIAGSAYSGEVLEHLLVRTTTGNKLVRGGHIRVEPNVIKKLTLPRLRVGQMLQKPKTMPKNTDSKGDVTYDERALEPMEFMVYTHFNPRDFEAVWRPFQPTGPLVFAELPPNVQVVMLDLVTSQVELEVYQHMINGTYGTGEGEFFNGLIYRAENDTDILSVGTPEAITSDNILDKLRACSGKVPDAIREHPDLKMFMSRTDFDIYDDVISNLPNKGKGWDEVNRAMFKGIKIVPLPNWPKDVLLTTVANKQRTSNLWAGVAFKDDPEALLIDKVTNAGEEYFIKMLLKADTQIKFGEDAVFYDGRAAEVEPVEPAP